MNARIKTLITGILLSLFVLSACAVKTPQQAPANIANPAADHCVQKGGRSEIRTAADGSQSGACVFPDGSECDEWAYFRNECAPGANQPSTSLDTMLTQGDPKQVQLDAVQLKAVEIVRAKLSEQISVEADRLDLISIEAVDWPDACLGIAAEGEMCAQVITPGFRISFSSGEKNFTFRTNLDAGVIRQDAIGIEGQ